MDAHERTVAVKFQRRLVAEESHVPRVPIVSDVRQEIEVFVIFVLPAVAFADRADRFDETDFANSFDHLESDEAFEIVCNRNEPLSESSRHSR